MFHGQFLTMETRMPRVEAVLIKDGNIEETGTLEELQALCPDAVLRDMGGAVILPGFIDGHSHLTAVADSMALADLKPEAEDGRGTMEEIREKLKKKLEEMEEDGTASPDTWVIGTGYDNSLLPGGAHPDRRLLDQVSEKYPVAAVHVSGHICAVNTRGMEILGYTGEAFQVPEGGTADRNGLLKENAFLAPEKQKKMMNGAGADRISSIGRASEYYASFGITTAQDARASVKDYEDLRAAGASGRLKCDVALYFPEKEAEKILPRTEPGQNPYQDMVRTAGCKMFLDGSPQGKTAWLSEPYYQVPPGEDRDYCGSPILGDDEVTGIMTRCIRNRWQINVHVNGDAAIEQMIRCFEKAAEAAGTGSPEKNPGAGLRPVAIHCQTVRKDQLERMAQDGIRISFFHDHVYYWGDYHRDSVLGPERASHISPLSWADGYGIPFTLHQDSPVVPPNVLFAVHNAVNRRTSSGSLLGPEHRISVERALRAVTLDAAAQLFEEDTKGSIRKGKRADFVVLDRNPLTVPAEEIRKIRILETIKNGETTYQSKKDCILR